MTVTEQLMKPGSFHVQLLDDAPYSAWSAVQEFDHIVITPVRLDQIAAYSDANILGSAIYTGVVTGKPSPIQIEGQGLAYWLGTDDGRGDVLDTAVTQTTATLSTWVTALLPSSLTVGTVTNTGNTLTYTYQWVTRREAIDHMTKAVGGEWRINPAGTFDAAVNTTLFVNTPTAVITRKPEGHEGTYAGVEASLINQTRDVDGYTTKVIVIGKTGDGAQYASGSATGSNVYKDFNNNNVVLERLVDAPTTPAANVTSYATSVLNLYSSLRRGLTIASDTYAVPIVVKPGDWVYVFDQRADLYDTANQINWRGELITPIKLRCKAYTWPIQRGMGVYARRSGATPTYTDLTEFVAYEDTTETFWEVGTAAGDPDQDPTQLTPAYLGVNADIAQRINQGLKVAYTPTWSGTIGNGTLAAWYVRIGDFVIVFYDITWGSTTSHAAATQSFSIPFTADRTFGATGNFRLEDTGVQRWNRTSSLLSTTTIFLDAEAGVVVSNTVPWTMGNTDRMAGHACFVCA
jgi:hypothetical protein